MKHLIETTDLSSLPITRYDRLILDSTTNEIVCKGGGSMNMNLYLMITSTMKPTINTIRNWWHMMNLLK